MELPIRVVVTFPSRSEVWALLGSGWPWLLALGVAVGGLGLIPMVTPLGDEAADANVALHVTSAPSGAVVTIDGRQQGHTPISIPLRPGEHRVTVAHKHYADARYQLSLSAGETREVHTELLLRAPEVTQLRPVFPGATITGGAFLIDGRVALTIALPPGDERQLWTVGPQGAVQRIGAASVRGAIALSADGGQIAFFRSSRSPGTASDRLDELWTAAVDGQQTQQQVRTVKANDERFFDVTWTPDGRRLLVASRQQALGGGGRTRIQSLDPASGDLTELVSMPSEVIPASHTWSADGSSVAFLTRSGQLTSLCLLNLLTGQFRYLADLSRDDSNPLPFAPLAWSPDGQRALYAAPSQDRASAGGWLFGAKPTTRLFATEFGNVADQPTLTAEGQFPTWLSDGRVLAIRRGQGGTLSLHHVEPLGDTRTQIELPLKVPSAYAVRWDPDHAQALIAIRGPAGLGASQADYWLVRFRPEQGP